MRLNRAQAFIRDQERERTSPGPDSIQNQACIAVWRELMGNWKRRTQLINYCVSVVDESIAENKDLAERSDNPAEQRRAQATSYAEEVKRNQIRNERTVEKIIRQRAIDAFHSRCQYFTPPQSDQEANSIWEDAKH
ncbi:hypothetical protein CC1G_00294 [Coprinopsis cinerea okayama7|uniref:Uncharacterized protein n=1 Tax=Coprinopsis cinerea (strain Okayama-7 / 130 / ATCC MYA-4618 / FGSC 9003) TaxID=240176 RepID=A8NXG1_COPC7|nr:hypothetical protein CC1G_00294 [Coprinopsis cinerea okayama7\|eukprot:XP_001837158.2 hypothetical protein CC1G_00294 [Coprinopsis cinerea okayama7\